MALLIRIIHHNGSLDEPRFYATPPSSAELEADFNSQSDPSTFWSLGTEVPLSPPASNNFPALRVAA